MKFVTGLALVLLCLVGYSSGSVLAGRGKKLVPTLGDLLVIVILWISALMAREYLGRWLAILAWLLVGVLVGAVLVALRRSRLASASRNEVNTPSVDGENLFRRVWRKWTAFAAEMGNYQGRVMLAFFYFVVVSPFGLLMRLFSDPLRMRRSQRVSFWVKRPELGAGLEDARRQF